MLLPERAEPKRQYSPERPGFLRDGRQAVETDRMARIWGPGPGFRQARARVLLRQRGEHGAGVAGRTKGLNDGNPGRRASRCLSDSARR